MLNEKNISFYTLICMEFGVTGGIDIHEEINTGTIDEANAFFICECSKISRCFLDFKTMSYDFIEVFVLN